MTAFRAIFALAAALALLAHSVPAQATFTDTRIEWSAKSSYAFKSYLKGDDIRVRSMHSSVILLGVVSDKYHRMLAQETAAAVPGVKSVDNRLEIRGDAPAENSDAWLRDKVKAALLLHASASGATTRVEAKGGQVTLRGSASSRVQKEMSSVLARDVEGVKGVKNEMSVSIGLRDKTNAGKNIDDASVTSQVKLALLYHRASSALATSVVTRKGVVTLSGRVRSQAEANLTTRLVSDVNGVREVKNRLVVE
jgi:hyperosmotically inducible periplasmic protein